MEVIKCNHLHKILKLLSADVSTFDGKALPWAVQVVPGVILTLRLSDWGVQVLSPVRLPYTSKIECCLILDKTAVIY